VKLPSSRSVGARQRSRGTLTLLWIILAFSALALAQTAKMRLGLIAFFGSEGLDVSKIKAALPVREGEQRRVGEPIGLERFGRVAPHDVP